MQYISKKWKFSLKKKEDSFLSFFFAQNIDCGYTLEPPRLGSSNEYPQSMFLSEAVLTCTHNLCFGAKIRKIGINLHTPVLLYKRGGFNVRFTDMFT